MKILKLLFVLSIAFLLASCEEETPEPQPNIVDIAVADAQFSTLVDALTKANLVSTLQGGSYTVFAPTNAAFEKLFTALGVSGISDLSAETLTPILLYHVVAGEARAADLSAGYIPTASEGPSGPASTISLKVDLIGGVKLNNTTNVTTADVDASNGVIHIIDEVLLPPNVVSIATGNENFSILVAALTRADLPTDFVTFLSGDGPFTVFAPTNQAFQDLLDSNPDWNSLDDIDAATLDAVLKYHVLNEVNLISGDITSGAEPTTVQGSTFTANVDEAGVTIVDGQGNTANVALADVQGTNGVVHVIDRVILP